jgi:hypothetical protein
MIYWIDCGVQFDAGRLEAISCRPVHEDPHRLGLMTWEPKEKDQ